MGFGLGQLKQLFKETASGKKLVLWLLVEVVLAVSLEKSRVYPGWNINTFGDI